ncbi:MULTISPECIES: LPXTG cell wall anchor domain-containing protein [unclassified Streptomyces]|uniref:LPXTG cell wall anchor domain-containing protein n=1 Tax=unclassified Streptomyces TaxID=2593676 RepID=UPI0020359C5F|nr:MULTISPECIES: LPXTG cell wall anchor domain-containing protein [unclassified Streptomyces]
MPISRNRWAAATLPVAASLLLAAGAAPAFAADDTFTRQVHQTLPLTATSNGVKNEKECADIPANQDGWHFVLPGNSTTFVKLTVTFEPGGQKVVTVFGPPSDKHAYVASEPGAKLTAASAELKGADVPWFNLSHTCPATTKPSPSTSTSPSTSPSTSVSPSSSTSASPSVSKTASPSVSASVSPSSGAPTSPAPSASVAAVGGSTGGDLAKTGSDAPIGLLATMAGALIAAGTVLVVRRRKASAQG